MAAMIPASTDPSAVTASAEASGADRPMRAPPSNSTLPSSSGARVFRITASTAAIPVRIAAMPWVRQSARLPTSAPPIRPMRKSSPTLFPTDAARSARAPGVDRSQRCRPRPPRVRGP